MKVLYISYDGMTDALGRSQVIPYLEGLSGLGHKIHIISCEKHTIPEEETREVKSVLSAAGITWSPLPFSTRPAGLSKLLDIYRIKRKAAKLHQQHPFDIVHCRSYIAALAGLDLKLRYGVRFIFDMRGFWADERIEGGMWNLSNPLYRVMFTFFKKKEKEFFHHADAVISLTHNGKQVIKEIFGAEKKTTVIPCCVDTDLFSPSENQEELEKLRLELGIDRDDFIFSYLGSIGTWYMTDEMLMFFKKLLSHYPRARFLFISGDNADAIRARASFYKIAADKVIVARATRHRVPLYLSLSAISVFFIKPVFSKKASSPTKQAEIMSMGIPLICNTGVGDTDRLFSDERAGLVVQGFTDEDFETAIEKIEDLLKIDPADIRSKAIELFNLKDGIHTYNSIYHQLMTLKE